MKPILLWRGFFFCSTYVAEISGRGAITGIGNPFVFLRPEIMFKTYKCHLDSPWLFSGNPFNMIHGLAVSSGTTGFGTDFCIHRFGMRVQALFFESAVL